MNTITWFQKATIGGAVFYGLWAMLILMIFREKISQRNKDQDDSSGSRSNDDDEDGTKLTGPSDSESIMEQGSSNSSPLHAAVPGSGTSKTIE
ncbi:hypothetical protein FQA39_LY09591 [Lamprigera yunnana]|nr:hypothetical protein FQA39_LY09591 [Lamprigera yunnana]